MQPHEALKELIKTEDARLQADPTYQSLSRQADQAEKRADETMTQIDALPLNQQINSLKLIKSHAEKKASNWHIFLPAGALGGGELLFLGRIALLRFTDPQFELGLDHLALNLSCIIIPAILSIPVGIVVGRHKRNELIRQGTKRLNITLPEKPR